MSAAHTTIQIPTAEEIAAAVALKMADMGLVRPSGALDINGAAAYLGLSVKTVRALVARGELRAGNATAGDGNKATLRFSVVELERWLAGVGG